ncbi:MAG: hypothetical protein FWG14_01575 [Peptococcaceae bacterium]|nr:hypothetical protein [Peptococcaceae bacterium]
MTKEEMQELKLVLVDVVETRLARTEEVFDSKLATMQEGLDKRFDGVDKRFDGVDKRFDGMDKRFDSMGKEISEVKEKVTEVDKRLRKLEIKVEHDISKAIKITMEGHAGLNEKMNAVLNVAERVETLEHKMSAVEYYIREQRMTQ